MKNITNKLLWFAALLIVILISYGSVTGFIKERIKHKDNIIQNKQTIDYGYEWVNVTKQAPFAPRDGAGALVFNNRMWLIGGWGYGAHMSPNNPMVNNNGKMITHNEVWSSRDGLDWDLEKANTFLTSNFNFNHDWEGRHTAGYVVFKGKMWIVGGDANQGHYQPDIWNSEDGKNWTWVNKGKPVPWNPRVMHYTVVFKDCTPSAPCGPTSLIV